MNVQTKAYGYLNFMPDEKKTKKQVLLIIEKVSGNA